MPNALVRCDPPRPFCYLIIAAARRNPTKKTGLSHSAQCVEDFRHIVDYLVTLPYVDEGRAGVLGICGGGGYSINAR